MSRTGPWIVPLATLALLAGCDRAADDASPARSDAPSAPTTAAASRAPDAAPPVQAVPPSDPDNPLPLPALQFEGRGAGKAESRYYAFDAGAGTITVTATARNAPSGSTQALGVALYDLAANRLCFDTHGNTTEPKTLVLTCTVEKAQPLLLRLDLSAESLEHSIALAGPVTSPSPKAAAAKGTIAGAGSTDIDAPTRLTTDRIAAEGDGKAASYYYTFNAGPGDLTLIGDGRNTSAATTEALRLGLYTLRSERLCEVGTGNTTQDRRVTTVCSLDERQPVILRADVAPETVAFRARFEGPHDFEAYTPPAVVTIALDASVLFDTGKSTLKPEARETLQEAAERVKKFDGASVLISGHTDDAGSKASNLALSERRAAAVRDYFVTQASIPPDRLVVRGFADARPVADNATDAGRARNRRVDVVITPAKG